MIGSSPTRTVHIASDLVLLVHQLLPYCPFWHWPYNLSSNLLSLEYGLDQRTYFFLLLLFLFILLFQDHLLLLFLFILLFQDHFYQICQMSNMNIWPIKCQKIHSRVLNLIYFDTHTRYRNELDRCTKIFFPFVSLHLWLYLLSLSFSSFFLCLSLHFLFFLLLSFSWTFTSPFFFLFFPLFSFLSPSLHLLYLFYFFLVHLGRCHWDRLSPWRSLILISLFFFFFFFVDSMWLWLWVSWFFFKLFFLG